MRKCSSNQWSAEYGGTEFTLMKTNMEMKVLGSIEFENKDSGSESII